MVSEYSPRLYAIQKSVYYGSADNPCMLDNQMGRKSLRYNLSNYYSFQHFLCFLSKSLEC